MPEETNPEENVFNQTEFNTFVTTALEQIKKINIAHKELFEGDSEKEAVIAEIESVLAKLIAGYTDLFVEGATGISKIGELNLKRDEIIALHKEMLLGDGVTKSIKADVEESQEKITEFYIYLFGSSDGTAGKEKAVREAIDKVIKFHTELVSEEGYEKVVKNAHTQITKTHSDLYKLDATTGDSKISKLTKDIANITAFNEDLNKKILPFIDTTKADIERNMKDVGSLLASAVGGGLIQGFLESKNEYNQKPVYKKIEGSFKNRVVPFLHNILMLGINIFTIIMDYVFFILPLTISVLIFVQPDNIPDLLGIDHNSAFLSSLNFTGRLLVSLPLWWISLFGYKNIRHKKRLAEEYNHKAQVTRMYLNFSSRETAEQYPISVKARAKLDYELISVISRHPGQIYGKDETIFDKLIELAGAMRGSKPAEIAEEVLNGTLDAK